MRDEANPSPPTGSNRMLAAVRLGWLTVEAFGRLRRYARSGRKPDKDRGDATRRFDFSDRTLDQHGALFLAIDQLKRTAGKLDPALPAPPFPTHDELEKMLDGGLDLNVLQGRLDDWSTQVWVAFSTEDELLGRGFTYGGSLADTYWHTDVLGPDGFGELLRSRRLEYIAARFDSIADYLPPYTGQVLHHTLYQWRIHQQLQKLDAAGKKQKMRRLESQAKVWHDLLFGSRSADSYLTAMDSRLIAWGAMGATAILVLAATSLVWLAVLTLSSAGRAVAASMSGLSQRLSEAQMSFVDNLLDWQKWSTLLATLSSVVVLLTGLVTRLSGWVIEFHHLAKEWLKLQFIYRRTYRF